MSNFVSTVPRARPDAESFSDLLARNGIALFDGAMGTIFYEKGVFINRPFEELNLTRPSLVRELHADYLAAGAHVLGTNTFSANRFRLSGHGLAGDVDELNRRGVELAREVAGDQAWISGVMGPLEARIEPFGPIAKSEARDVFAEQARALALAGVDLFGLESFGHLPELLEAIHAVREASDLPVVAQILVGKAAVTREGVRAGDAARQMVAAGASVVGVNCSEALATLDALEDMRRHVDVPLSGQPNAGIPRTVQGRNLYLASPAYIVAWARRALRAGARLLGGCCGTRPDHIRSLYQVIREAAPDTPAEVVRRPTSSPRLATPTPRRDKSLVARALDEGRFVTGLEMTVPRGWVVQDLLAVGRRVVDIGGMTLSLPESTSDEARMPPIALAPLCRRIAGLEPLAYYACRGRRLSHMQSDLLGAWANGASDLVLVTGEPSSYAGDAEPDLDVDSIGLVNLANRLNHGEDLGGNPLGAPTGFHVGVRLDPTAFDRQRELSRLYWKIEAGADYALTAPVFDPAALASFLEALEGPRIPVIASVWALSSAREAEFFEHELADVPVPAPLVERMRRAEAADREEAEGLAIARELAMAVRPLVQGLQVIVSGDRVDVALELLETIRGG